MRLYKRVDTRVTIQGERITQNQWVYTEVTKVIATDRIAMFKRYNSRLNDLMREFALSKQPTTYRILENI